MDPDETRTGRQTGLELPVTPRFVAEPHIPTSTQRPHSRPHAGPWDIRNRTTALYVLSLRLYRGPILGSMSDGQPSAVQGRDTRLGELTAELRALEERVREGGGRDRVARQHEQGKLTARERIELLRDPGSRLLEIGPLVAWDRYQGQAPAAGVVTVVTEVSERPAVVVANDATVKAGAWWPETITKILRAQEIAMRCRVPIVYLVDSAGVNLPYQGGVFPGQYGAG